MRTFKAYILPFFLRHLAALAIISLTILLIKPVDKLLGAQIIGLIYLLPVMLSTVLLGLSPGILAAFAAFLTFNYFFIPPYNTLSVHQTRDLITLIIFLIVSVVMSQLIGQAREGMRLAKTREWEATRMYELISALSGLNDNQSIARTLAEHTLEAFRGDTTEVFIESRKGEPSLTVRAPDATAAGKKLPSLRIPMLTARGLEGEIRVWHNHQPLTLEEERLLETFASQGALAIERTYLAKGENKARLLEESDRMKSSLLNSVSHELRSPLAAIKASISGLRSEVVDWDSAARQDLIETIEEETDHLNFLVGNLLDMSRIESGALKPQIRWNSLAEIATGVAIKMRKQIEGFRLVMDFPEGLPLVPTDYVLIGQVFTNLISNSVKYAPPDTAINISASKERDTVHVKVTNEGPPVPEEHLERIFDKFYRVTAADRITGTGLGLSICKGIIEAHGGRIWAENTPCCFAFHFTLPITINGSLPETPKEIKDE
ncbi:MAG TPA: DUF4118 domain-containing protein [Anaerolineaceae bacterium]